MATVLMYDTEDLTEEQVALFQTAVIDTLGKLGIEIEYDETSTDGYYKVRLQENQTIEL